MASSVRQQIVDALKTRLGTITKINGYETDLGANVSEWRTTDWQESELEGVDVRDPDEDTEAKGQYHYKTIHAELEAKVKDAAAPGVARDVIADIDKAIGTDPTFGGLAYKTTPVENESMDFEKKDKSFGGVLMKLEISYRIKDFEPYSVA